MAGLRRPSVSTLIAVALLVVFAFLPYVSATLPGLLPDRINGPGSMQLLALCLTMAGIALSYDVLFGRTGLLSFGHALFVTAGSYLLTILMAHAGMSLLPAALIAVVGTAVLSAIVGVIALRVSGIAFAMVTLAFAQGASIVVMRNPGHLTGGEEGLSLSRDGMPVLLIGVLNAPYRYWVALGFVTLAWIVVTWLGRSRLGHAMAAVRENEARAAVLGLKVQHAKLAAIVVASALGGLGGIVHAIVLGGSNPHLTTAEFTLSLLVMVVLGGAGHRWGAVLGGFLYTYADWRLVGLAGTEAIHDLPLGLGKLVSQPLFLLGLFFILVVYFAPAGLTGLSGRLLRRKAS